jgi:hypothetical protein
VSQATESLDLAKTSYDLDLSSIVELNQAQLNMTEAQIENARARYEYQIRYAVLQHNIGALHQIFSARSYFSFTLGLGGRRSFNIGVVLVALGFLVRNALAALTPVVGLPIVFSSRLKSWQPMGAADARCLW